jgi:hypothetical protein
VPSVSILRVALTAGVATALTGCGWGYAEQVEKSTLEPAPVVATAPPPRPEPVVRPAPARAKNFDPSVLARAARTGEARLMPGARDLYTLGENHRLSLDALTPQDMGLHSFQVRLVDAVNDATQVVHCSSGKTIRFQKRAPDATTQARMAEERLLAGVWLLTIDPSGQRADLPNNDWYRHISRFHRLEFVKRTGDGLVVYRYLGPRDSTAAR